MIGHSGTREVNLRRRFAIAIGTIVLAGASPFALSAGPPAASAPDEAQIRRFFGLIDRHRPEAAVAMMGPEIASGPRERSAWIRQFSAIKSIAVRGISPAGLGDEGPCRSYRVTLTVQLMPQGNLAAIPSFGWGPNPNLRWVTLCPGKRSEMYIASLATGP